MIHTDTLTIVEGILNVIQLGSIFCAVAAAKYWRQSTKAYIPKAFSIKSSQPFKEQGLTVLTKNEEGFTYVGENMIGNNLADELRQLAYGLSGQGIDNSKAANYAAASALLQMLVMFGSMVNKMPY